MTVEIHVYLHHQGGGIDDPRLTALVENTNEILAGIRNILAKESSMSASITTMDQGLTMLKGDVTNLTDVVSSAKGAFAGIAAQLAQALQNARQQGATAEQLQAITDLHTTIQTETDDLAQSVAANTQAAAGA